MNQQVENTYETNIWFTERVYDGFKFRTYADKSLAGRLECIGPDGTVYDQDLSYDILHEKTLQTGGLWKASIEPTARCNVKCIHCYVGDERYIKINEIKIPEISQIMDQLLKRNCLFLTLTGGEFFVRPDAIKIIELAVEKGFAVSIQSNGSLIRENVAISLSKMPIFSVEISIYGLTEQVHDDVTQIKGSYKRTIDGLSMLKKYNIPTGIKFVITNLSSHQAKMAKEWGDSIGIPHTISPQMLPARDSSNDNEKTDGFCDYVISAIKDVANNGKINIQKNLSYRRNCKPGVNRLCVSSTGKVKPCEFLPMELADLRYENINEAWNKKTWEEFRNNISKPRSGCTDCSAKNYCAVCPASSYMMGNSFQATPKRGCNMSFKLKNAWEAN